MSPDQSRTSRPLLGYLIALAVASAVNLYLVIDVRCQLRAAVDDEVNVVAREVLRLLEPQFVHQRQVKRHSDSNPVSPFPEARLPETPPEPPPEAPPEASSVDGVSFNVNGTRYAPEFYATVPMDVMTRFCKDSTTYCGSEFVRGEKGDWGPVGPPGLKGSKGEPGLDGVDGTPGQPGLDGTLGAQGADGPKGDKGDAGIPGTHGMDGINGIHGISGQKGEKGVSGYPGLRGQRGLKGDQGERGEAGIPGIQTWMPENAPLNSAADIFIPPEIVLSPESTLVEVTEGVSLSLSCSAYGQPVPSVSWSRIDGKPIFGNPHVSSVEGKQLNISLVTRADMGVYACTASNGIPPIATRTISLNVAFAPLIRIQKWNVASWNGGGVVFECLTEAYPPPVNFWISRSGNIIGEWHFGFEVNYVEGSLKYIPRDEMLSLYQHRMTLNITYVTPSDLGSYLCVSKNVRGQAVGTIDLSNQNEPLDWRSSSEEVTFGTEAKEKQHTQCLRRCPESRCKSVLPEMADVRNEYSDVDKRNWTRKPDRNPACTLDSRLSRVGKPVMYLENGTAYSAWWQDEVYNPDNDIAARVFYATKHGDNNNLYMFKTRELFQDGTPSKTIPLISPFHGNGNLLMNGTFFYHQNASNNIVRVPLNSRSLEQGEMSVFAVEDLAFSNRTFLFGQQQNYALISADENGLWIIYSSTRSNNTMILKIDEKTFEKQFIWNLTLPHRKIGQMFIMCGILYAVNSVTEPNAQIYMYAYDLVADTIINLEAPIAFTNPFANTTFLTYNSREHELFSTDNGNHLVYPVRSLEEDRQAEVLQRQLKTA